MQHHHISLFGILLFSCLSFSSFADDDLEFEVEFVALNNSGVIAEAEIELIDNNMIEVSIKARGLEADKIHPQHIHGHLDSLVNSSCPGLTANVNDDKIISVGEGLPFYGPIVLPLGPFDTVNSKGKLKYKEVFEIDSEFLEVLENRTIILHGGTVDGIYIPSLPIACGEIHLDD